MSSIALLALQSLDSDQARIERVASNLANVQTPGYKREMSVDRAMSAGAFSQAMSDAGAMATAPVDAPANGPASLPAATMLSVLARDMSTGTLRNTGRGLDVALTGRGWFEVGTDHGPAYTRRGDFQIDASGRLVTQDGQPLLGRGGEISVSAGGKLRIDGDGKVFDDDKQVGQLRVVNAGPEQLTAMGAGLYSANGPVQDLPAGEVSVRQGFLENANVDPAHEMLTLTQSVRHFEAMLRIVQGRDDMLGTAIRKLGDM